MKNIINSINENFILANKNAIDKIRLGFIDNDYCIPFLYSITIHCIENIKIFNEDQLTNIEDYINKLNYG